MLADNCVTRIQFSTDDDGALTLHDSRDDLDDWEGGSGSASASMKTRLMFPNLSMLDLSNNQLREIPSNIHELSNLSVLNISGNAGKRSDSIVFGVFACECDNITSELYHRRD